MAKQNNKRSSVNDMDLTDEERAARKRAKQRAYAANRRERDEMLEDLGLTKVRGAISGRTYWE